MTTTKPATSRLRRSGLNRTTIGAAAVGSIGATLMTAHAEIIHSGEQNLSTSSLLSDVPFDGDVEPVNLDGAGVDEFTLMSFNTKGSNFHLLQNQSPDFGNLIGGASSYVYQVEVGEIIGPGGTYDRVSFIVDNLAAFDPDSQWHAGDDGYFGFRFNPSGSQDLFGWGNLTISQDETVLTLVDWAYENTGAPIHAGQIPEPTTCLLLTASLTVAALWRRCTRTAAS